MCFSISCRPSGGIGLRTDGAPRGARDAGIRCEKLPGIRGNSGNGSFIRYNDEDWLVGSYYVVAVISFPPGTHIETS